MGAAPQLSVRGRHLPALDGLRALAVLAVFAYHLGFGWASGGYLGVDLFFVLSGFLITSLIVEERLVTGRLGLGAFYGRRARRLLPGLILLLVCLGVFLACFGAGPLVDLHQLRDDAFATVAYLANWHQLFSHQSYFDRLGAPSPLQHTWSLGIEEQFYLLWPLTLIGLFATSKKLWRKRGILLALGGALASAGWMAYLSVAGASYDRLYYGTDTRAFDLLAGAVLAFATAGLPQPGRRSRRLLALAGPLAALALGLFWWRAGGSSGEPSRAMFEGGFALCGLLAVVVLAEARLSQPSLFGRLLSLPPLLFVGQISYELYLWHWPVICELTEARLGFGGLLLDAVRLAVAFVAATASYVLVDRPIRRWAFSGWPSALRLATVPAAMVLGAAVMVLGTLPAAEAAPAVALGRSRHVPGAGHVVGGPIRLTVKPTSAHRLRVLLIGDSVMRAAAPAITAALDSTGEVSVRDDGYDGWGFTTDTTWRRGVPQEIKSDHAELVVAMWSFDDDFLAAHPVTYRRWMREFVHIVLSTPGVAGLVFQQFPLIGPDAAARASGPSALRSANAAIGSWDRLVATMAAADPARVMYLPLASSVERSGRFSSFLPPGDKWSLPLGKWVRVRSEDGVHLCPAGAARYADALYFDLRQLYGLARTAPSWSTGRWTRDERYEEPPGNCPDDHP